MTRVIGPVPPLRLVPALAIIEALRHIQHHQIACPRCGETVTIHWSSTVITGKCRYRIPGVGACQFHVRVELRKGRRTGPKVPH